MSQLEELGFVLNTLGSTVAVRTRRAVLRRDLSRSLDLGKKSETAPYLPEQRLRR